MTPSNNGIPKALAPDSDPISLAAPLVDRFLGLGGWPGQVAKLGLSATMGALLVLMVYWGHQDALAVRGDARQDMGAIRKEANEAHRTMAVMLDTLRETRDSTHDLTHAIKGLTVEVRRLKEAEQAKRPDDQPPGP